MFFSVAGDRRPQGQAVPTLVGPHGPGPGRGGGLPPGRLSLRDAPWRGKPGIVMFIGIYAVPAGLSAALARIVSRHRVLAADRGAAMLTGSPSALTAALLRLSGELERLERRLQAG